MQINIQSHEIIQYCIDHNITLSVAESCSGGLLSKTITDVPGCSTIYPGGVCSYSNDMKMKWLHVNSSTLEQHGAVSAETALEMAQGIRNATGSDYGLSTTGVAGPGGGTPDKPVGLVYIAVVSEHMQKVEPLPLDTSLPLTRTSIQQQTVAHALTMLWNALHD